MDVEQLRDQIGDKVFSGVAIDSREVRGGQVFFALRGEKVDGHAFLAEVAARGARAAVVSKEYRGADYGLTLVAVEDVLQTLQRMAKEVFARRRTKVLGITGSVGKTTTKEFIATLLQERFHLAKTPGTYNSQVTFPLSILNSPGDEELFVMEMGMSLAGEMARLVDIAPPDVAFVGRLALAHVASFPDGLEGIAREKAQILSHEGTRAAILHAKTYQFNSFSRLNHLDIRLYDNEDFQIVSSQNGWNIQEKGKCSPEFSLPFAASHLRENLLGAIAVARFMGMCWKEIIPQISKLSLVPRRFQEVQRGGVLFINDAYNANPTSMRSALENLPLPQEGRRIGVLGEMRELGSFSKTSHQEIGELALDYVDELLCFGEECTPMAEAFLKGGGHAQLFTDFTVLKTELERIVRPGDVVLIKGSNSKQMWMLLE